MRVSLKNALHQASLDTMNFLNEVVLNYPRAISFAPGRPEESLFDVEGSLAQVKPFVARFAREAGVSAREYFNGLGQYGKTNGLICRLIADYLQKDEHMTVEPADIMVTSGCQEAMAILLMGLFEPGRDVLLVSDPTYIGITGIAQILEIDIWPVPAGPEGLEPEAVSAAVAAIKAGGKNPKAIYDVPDFNNPLGTSMPLAKRRSLLETAAAHDLLIFEDNPYGMFAYDGKPMPTLKSLDETGTVIYLGTFSKTLFPGLRVGYLVASQNTSLPDGTRRPLTAELSKIKSFLSVNTSPILQAIVGGVLLENGGTLMSLLQPKIDFYRTNRDHMLACLQRYLAETDVPRELVQWNRPGGGFFLTVELPFEFGEDCLSVCAKQYGVICCPMSLFTLAGDRRDEIRLSFSYVNREQIDRGIQQLARFIRDKIEVQTPSPTKGRP